MAKIQSSWDIAKPFPLGAFACDSFGRATEKGRYIAWPEEGATVQGPDKVLAVVPNGSLASQMCFISKIIKQHVREEVFNYKNALRNPIDMTDKKLVRKIQSKINYCLTKLGVAYADRVGVVVPQNGVACAAWFTTNKGEGIYINPYWVAKADMSIMMRIIKKEVIHKALFRNLKELTNKRLLNFVIDVLAMRVIAQTPFDKLDKNSVRLCEMLYNPKMYKRYPLLALLDCSLSDEQAKRLPVDIYNIWASLYKQGDKRFLPSLTKIKPTALYFQIKSIVDDLILDDIQNNAGFYVGETRGNYVTNYPWNVGINYDLDGRVVKDTTISPKPNRQSANIQKAVRGSFVPRVKRFATGFSNGMTKFWDNEVVNKQDCIDDGLKEFAEKWRTQKILDGVEGKLKQELERESVKTDPYPADLTEEGTMLAALGFSGDLIPLFFNHDDDVIYNKKKVLAFFDLSPSMEPFLSYMVDIVESIEDVCSVSFARNDPDNANNTVRGAYGFSGNVTELDGDDLEDMKSGKFKIGKSTSFVAVVEYVLDKIKTENVDLCLIFTDGKSSVTQALIDEFNRSGKKMFRVYFTPRYGGPEDNEALVESDLDQLNGESFTLCLPPTQTLIRR